MANDIPLIGPIINRIFGSRNERFVRRYSLRVEQITALEPEARRLTDPQIKARSAELRARFVTGARIDDILVDAFALAREAMDRAIGIRNIFNPRLADQFPWGALPEEVRRTCDALRAEMDAAEPRAVEGEFLGCAAPQPGWVWMDIPVEVYEAVRQALPQSKPPFRARPFDVQLIGGMVLFQRKIAEMKTGEGKTIVAPLACYLASLAGQKVHVVTVNDYLVQRDRDWTYPYFHALGLTVGAIHPMHIQDEEEKRRMYECDIVYGTTAEFGFDYLRDNMKRSVDQQVQRVREFAVVDEVDSILIDEARTPLIISGLAHENTPRYELADRLARRLVEAQKPWTRADEAVEECKKRIKGTEGDIRNAREKSEIPALQQSLARFRAELPELEAQRGRHTQYFELERDRKQAHLTSQGVVEAQKTAGIGSFYVGENIDMPHLLEQSLRAHAVYERDRDYIVAPTPDQQTGRTEPGVVIVDVNTGRPMVGRQWSDGLHQAIEAKEGVRIKQETQTVASITIQNFFKMYKALAGMTGTADTEAQEFHDIYHLDVVTIPTNVPVTRVDYDDTVYLVGKDKWAAIVEEIKAFHDAGRPVLVGTTSVEKSETLSKLLTSRHAIRHEVLNAKQHEREANIVENAGQLGAVMIATNMAGRGTDIKLGVVTRAALLDHWLRRGLAPRELTVQDSDERLRELVFRKAAPKELGLNKREVEQLPFPELELALLRHWAGAHTWADEKKIATMSADALRRELDLQGRFTLHRLRWVESVEELGGLHVIGTERHESRRVDNQLRGRSGRQGDRGSSRFFVALDDDLMSMFAGPTTMKILSRLGMKEGDAIEHPMLSKSIVRAQRKVEERNFQIRKNILEYDEVMEHQRRGFYGMRQRVLEGRDVKGLLFEFIEDAVADAAARYLAPDYFAECVAEYARQTLGCSIAPERFRRRDREDAEALLRKEARDDALHEISVTIGEFIPEGGDPADIDSKGLVDWAAKRFAVGITEGEALRLSSRELREMLMRAAVDQIERADLSGVGRYLTPHYGAEELARWAANTLELTVPVQSLTAAESREQVIDLLVGKVREAYAKREVEYPIDFMMDMTMAMIRQSGPAALGGLVAWANARFDLGWNDSVVRTSPPQKIRDDLLRASRRFVESGALAKAIDAALACADNAELERHMLEKHGVRLPPWLLRLQGDDRAQAVRARVESVLRAELLQFERFVLLEVLDTAWKDHLYAMDQLRDSIGFRAFSQQDPRIEFKREGAQLYKEMLARVRDRASEYIFKMRMTPQVAPPPQPAPPTRNAPTIPPSAPPGAAPTAPGPRRLPLGGSLISGPGFDTA